MYYKKVLITVEKYVNAGVHTIKGNREPFRVKMTDVQKGLGLKKYARFSLKRKMWYV